MAARCTQAKLGAMEEGEEGRDCRARQERGFRLLARERNHSAEKLDRLREFRWEKQKNQWDGPSLWAQTVL